MPTSHRVGDRYEIVRELGRGASSVVYLAYDRSIDQQVALKAMTSLVVDPAVTNRFLRELARVEQLRHPNIVTVHDVFELDGVAYISMEYFERGSLRRWIGKLTLAGIGGVLEGVLAGLAHAAARGVVHRNVRPENVFVADDGDVKLADFGIARAIEYETGGTLTAAGWPATTPEYVAPEQAMAKRVDARADLYSAGVVAYELVTGRPPFAGESPVAILYQHVSERPPPPRSVDPDVDVRLSDWIERLLEKAPDARPDDAHEAFADLDEILMRRLGPAWRRKARLLERRLPSEDEAQPALSSLLREAALAGVVPADLGATAQPQIVPPPVDEQEVPTGPTGPSAPPAPPEPAAARPAPQPRIESDRTAPRGPRASLLRRVALPLIALGTLAAAAKWLLGLFTLAESALAAAADFVQCTVFAPPTAAPGARILVQVFVHVPEAADEARAIATELDSEAQRRAFRSLELPVHAGTRLDFELRLPGLLVEEPMTSMLWQRRTEAVQFSVSVPERMPASAVVGTVLVSTDSVPIGHVKFKLTIEADAIQRPSEPQGDDAHRYRFAFISYSSKDRDEVVRRVQLLPAVGIAYFHDVLSLDPGDRWLKRIEAGIDQCDLFLLFWSTEAKQSEWVREEVRYALARKAGDDAQPPEIRPVIVEGPPIVEPWEELAHLHFNDRLLYVLRAPTK